MKTFKITVRVQTLVGHDDRTIEVHANTEGAALKQVSRLMGNRDYQVITATGYRIVAARKSPNEKAIMAMDHIHKAIALLAEAGDDSLAATGNYAATNDYRYFETQLKRILIDDNGDAGLEPFVRGMKSRGEK